MARYREIADDLRHRIASGEWAPEASLPRHTDLAEHYGVTRNVVASAIAALEGEGLVMATPRRGTIVRNVKRRRITRGA